MIYAVNGTAMNREPSEGWHDFREIWLPSGDPTMGPNVNSSDFDNEGQKLCEEAGGAATTSAMTTEPTPNPPSPQPVSSPCTLPDGRDLIMWERAPRLLDNSIEIGEVDLVHCRATLDTFADEQPTDPGFCTKIACADDNPGYSVGERPSAPLNKVLQEVGPAC